jgi:hypothetical protein
VRLGGYTVATFGAVARASFISALAAAISTAEERISLAGVSDGGRRLSGSGGAGIVVDVHVGVTSARAAAAVAGSLTTVYAAPSLFVTAMKNNLAAAGSIAPAGIALAVESAPTFNRPPTSAPTPVPPTPAPTPSPTPVFDRYSAVSVTIEVSGCTRARFAEGHARFVHNIADVYGVAPSAVLIGDVAERSGGTTLAIVYYVRITSTAMGQRVATATTQPRMQAALMQATQLYTVSTAISAEASTVRLATTAEERSPTPAPTPAPTPPTPAPTLPGDGNPCAGEGFLCELQKGGAMATALTACSVALVLLASVLLVRRRNMARAQRRPGQAPTAQGGAGVDAHDARAPPPGAAPNQNFGFKNPMQSAQSGRHLLSKLGKSFRASDKELAAEFDIAPKKQQPAAASSGAISAFTPLAAGWFQAVDPNSGNTYYYDNHGNRAWTRPTMSIV